MSLRHATLCLSASIALSGCASIVSKSQYPVTFSSNPPGATVSVKNKAGTEIHRAQTPATVTLAAGDGFFGKASYSVVMEKEGHVPAQQSLSGTLDPWYLGNIIFGGLIGLLIVDPATGAMWQLEQNVMGGLAQVPGYTPPVALQPVPAAVAPASPIVPLAAPAESAAPVAAEASALPSPAAVAPAQDAAPPAPAKSVGERLKDLKVLRDDGTLTEQEYQAKRAQLIESL